MTSNESVMPTNPTPIKGLLMLMKLRPVGFFRFIFGSGVKKMDDSELLMSLIKGKSFIRWGDGETANLREKSTWHQRSNHELSTKLSELLDICADSENIIMGINFQAIRNSLFDKKVWDLGNRNRLLSSRALFNHKKFYPFFRSGLADAFFFYNNFEKLVNYLSLIAPYNRPILVINSDPEILPLLKDWKSITFVRINPRDAFDEYQEMERRVESWLNSLSSEDNGLLLLSGGSASKILVTKFSELCQIIDVGSGFSFAKDGNLVMDWDK